MSVNTSMPKLDKNRARNLLERVQDYFAQDLGKLYSQAVNRLTLYPFVFTFFLAECTTFWLIYTGKSFFINYMSFVMIFSLHKAAVYSLCIFMADTAVHYIIPSWGAFKKRTVGKQWLIWTTGLLTGFVIQQGMVKKLIIFYAPEVINYFIVHPEKRLGHLEILLFLMPYWCVVMYVTMGIAKSKQRIQDLAESLVIQPRRQPKTVPESLMVPQSKKNKDRLPGGNLNWKNETGCISIPLVNITHLTVEDHYCRINYSEDNDFKSKMIRLPLKEMLLKLPQDHFIKIHRSHVVNTAHVSRLKKKGRDHKVVIKDSGVELPVSRSCFTDKRTYFVPLETGD